MKTNTEKIAQFFTDICEIPSYPVKGEKIDRQG